jgi:hypothetical protein
MRFTTKAARKARVSPTGLREARSGDELGEAEPRKKMDCFGALRLAMTDERRVTLRSSALRATGYARFRHTPRMRGYPVRRSVSIPSPAPVEYWITRLRG